jgi:hypothetical protein
MAIKKIDPNLLAPLNESNLDGTYNISEPKQIYVDASFYTSQNLSYFDKKIGLKTERCKIVKVITTGATEAGPQVGSYPWTRRNSQGLSNTNMKIFQAIVIPTNASNQSVPLLANVSNLDEEPLDKIRLKFHTKAFLEYDSTKLSTFPKEYDEVLIEYVGNDTEEARIIEVYSKNNVGVPISPPTNPQTAFNNSDGTTIGDTKANTTGDVTQDLSNNALSAKPSTECGLKDNETYSLQPCYTANFDATGQSATLHPVFWNKVNDLLNKIKENEKVSINHRESIRSQQRQYGYRLQRCPAALKNLGEERFRSEPWPVLKANGPCLPNVKAVAAVTGKYASNHLIGLAIDFALDTKCGDKNGGPLELEKYEFCKANSKYYKLLVRYAPEFSVKQLDNEPWHWSHNGG